MKLGAIVMDCGNAEALADFYAEFLGWDKSVQETAEDRWVIVNDPAWKNTPLVFQEVSGYQSPVWPAETGRQQHPSGFLCGLAGGIGGKKPSRRALRCEVGSGAIFRGLAGVPRSGRSSILPDSDSGGNDETVIGRRARFALRYRSCRKAYHCF